MRERSAACRGASLDEFLAGRHQTFSDDGWCPSCRKRLGLRPVVPDEDRERREAAVFEAESVEAMEAHWDAVWAGAAADPLRNKEEFWPKVDPRLFGGQG